MSSLVVVLLLATLPAVMASDPLRARSSSEDRCISAGDRARIASMRAAAPVRQSRMQLQLGWPLKASPAFSDFHYYIMSSHVDQDDAPGSFSDYTCGARSYDGHNGTDIGISPFMWNMMEDEVVEVVAAADGEILDSHDGEFDKNCDSQDVPANFAIVGHEDGSKTFYWHLKSGSVTKKKGDTVVAGEKIGAIGSSGHSGGPHLHFEVHDPQGHIIDPFFEAPECNGLNGSSWWAEQVPYRKRRVMKIMMSDALIEESTDCGVLAVTHERSSFCPGETAYFYRFYADILGDDSAEVSILGPGGEEMYQASDVVAELDWLEQKPVHPGLRLRSVYNLALDATPGTWLAKVSYAETEYERAFEVSLKGCPCQVDGDCERGDVCEEESHTCTTVSGETEGPSTDTMEPEGTSTTGTGTTGADATSTTSTTTTSPTTSPTTGGGLTSPPSATTNPGSQPENSTGEPADSATTTGLASEGGCGCTTPGSHNRAGGLLLALLAIGRRRRALRRQGHSRT